MRARVNCNSNPYPIEGMNRHMTTLIVLIRHVEELTDTVDGIVAAICPYLGSFGERATIESSEQLRELRNGSEEAPATLLRVSLAGSSRVDFADMIAKLSRFLKQTAKDSNLELKFELWKVVIPAPY